MRVKLATIAHIEASKGLTEKGFGGRDLARRAHHSKILAREMSLVYLHFFPVQACLYRPSPSDSMRLDEFTRLPRFFCVHH